MAALINGAKVDEQVYEFGVTDYRGDVIPCESYEVAKDVSLVDSRAKLKMRCIYKTEWMDAT